MSAELKELLDQLRWLSEMGNHPYITVRVEGTAGKGVLAIDRKVLVEMLNLLTSAKEVADISAAFRAVDVDRMAHLRGCVMPDPTDAWGAARDAYRRATDAWLARPPVQRAGGQE